MIDPKDIADMMDEPIPDKDMFGGLSRIAGLVFIPYSKDIDEITEKIRTTLYNLRTEVDRIKVGPYGAGLAYCWDNLEEALKDRECADWLPHCTKKSEYSSADVPLDYVLLELEIYGQFETAPPTEVLIQAADDVFFTITVVSQPYDPDYWGQ